MGEVESTLTSEVASATRLGAVSDDVKSGSADGRSATAHVEFGWPADYVRGLATNN